jgi:hypothetical protein
LFHIDCFFTQPKQECKPGDNHSQTVTTPSTTKNIPTYKKEEMPGVSITQIINKNDKEEETERAAILAKENHPFSEEDLKKYWKLYQDRIPEKKILLSTMQTCKLTLNQDYSVSVVVDQQTQIKEFENESSDLLTFLSQSLKNGKIKFDLRVSEKGENKNTLSGNERLKEMVERNPAILTLVNEIGLELE